jgi:tRNA U34 2-thiouridine synthase MnmA/TrmU
VYTVFIKTHIKLQIFCESAQKLATKFTIKFETKNLQQEYAEKIFEYKKFVVTELLLPSL